MSCMWCARFHREYDVDEDPWKYGNIAYLKRMGQCTLTPEPVQVSGSHVCGSFVWKSNEMYFSLHRFEGPTTPIASLWLEARNDGKAITDLRAEVRRLKKVNKTLRAKMKAKEPAA